MKRFISIFFLAFLLFGSMGFAFSSHYCDGVETNSSLSIGPTYNGCGMDGRNCDTKKGKEGINVLSCCSNTMISLQIEDDYESFSKEAIAVSQVITPTYTYLFNLGVPVVLNKSYTDYTPPLPDKDFPVTFQSFLI